MDYSAIIKALHAQAEAIDRTIANLESLNSPKSRIATSKEARPEIDGTGGAQGSRGPHETLLDEAASPEDMRGAKAHSRRARGKLSS